MATVDPFYVQDVSPKNDDFFFELPSYPKNVAEDLAVLSGPKGTANSHASSEIEFELHPQPGAVPTSALEYFKNLPVLPSEEELAREAEKREQEEKERQQREEKATAQKAAQNGPAGIEYIDVNEKLASRGFTENELLMLARRRELKERREQRQAERKVLAPLYKHVERAVSGIAEVVNEERWERKKSVMLGSWVEVWTGQSWTKGEVVGIGTHAIDVSYFKRAFTNQWGRHTPASVTTGKFSFQSSSWRHLSMAAVRRTRATKKSKSKVQYYEYCVGSTSAGRTTKPRGIASGKEARERLQRKRAEARLKHLEETGKTSYWFAHEDGSRYYQQVPGTDVWRAPSSSGGGGGSVSTKPKINRKTVKRPVVQPRERLHKFNPRPGVEEISEEERQRIEAIALDKLIKQRMKYERHEKTLPIKKPKFIIRYCPELLPAPMRPVVPKPEEPKAANTIEYAYTDGRDVATVENAEEKKDATPSSVSDSPSWRRDIHLFIDESSLDSLNSSSENFVFVADEDHGVLSLSGYIVYFDESSDSASVGDYDDAESFDTESVNTGMASSMELFMSDDFIAAPNSDEMEFEFEPPKVVFFESVEDAEREENRAQAAWEEFVRFANKAEEKQVKALRRKKTAGDMYPFKFSRPEEVQLFYSEDFSDMPKVDDADDVEVYDPRPMPRELDEEALGLVGGDDNDYDEGGDEYDDDSEEYGDDGDNNNEDNFVLSTRSIFFDTATVSKQMKSDLVIIDGQLTSVPDPIIEAQLTGVDKTRSEISIQREHPEEAAHAEPLLHDWDLIDQGTTKSRDAVAKEECWEEPENNTSQKKYVLTKDQYLAWQTWISRRNYIVGPATVEHKPEWVSATVGKLYRCDTCNQHYYNPSLYTDHQNSRLHRDRMWAQKMADSQARAAKEKSEW